MSETQLLQVETVTRGAVPEDAMDLAVLRVRAELRAAPEPVRYVKIRLAMAADPGSGQPAVAQTSVDLNDRRVRAQAATETMRAAIELMCDKLKTRLERAAEQGAGGTGLAEGSGPGRRLDLRLPQPRRSLEAPSVVRHKSYRLSGLTPMRRSPILRCSITSFTCSPSGPPARTAWCT